MSEVLTNKRELENSWVAVGVRKKCAECGAGCYKTRDTLGVELGFDGDGAHRTVHMITLYTNKETL